MRIVSTAQMSSLEKEADQNGLTYFEMMNNAGLGLAHIVHERFFQKPAPFVLGLVGSGNNGGDTLVALGHLQAWGWRTAACLVKVRREDDSHVQDYRSCGGEIFVIKGKEEFERLRALSMECDCILDGILGTGVRLPLKGEVKKTLQFLTLMSSLPPIVAVDCPSGVDCDGGRAAKECLPATLTVCMAAVKQGLLKQPALALCGEFAGVEIGLQENLYAWQGVSDIEVVDARLVAEMMPDRTPDAHKGSFGTCMVAAGSVNYCGAVLLAAGAAYRAGAGLVRAAIPGAIYDAIAGQLPEATWLLLPDNMGVLNGEGSQVLLGAMNNVDSLLIGPGWGLENETLAFLRNLLEEARGTTRQGQIGFGVTQKKSPEKYILPELVVDADALKLLSRIEGWDKLLAKSAILTPHPGEMATLTGLGIKEIQMHRQEIAQEYARRWAQIVVLKGALTVIAAPDGRCALIPIADAALATAGSGDVLAGVIAALLAQGLRAYPASVCAAWLHARAGVRAAGKVGNRASIMAGDILRSLPEAIKEIGVR